MAEMSDKEQADDLRKRFNSMALPIVGLLQECDRKGFVMSFGINVKDGKPDLRCDISKVTKL